MAITTPASYVICSVVPWTSGYANILFLLRFKLVSEVFNSSRALRVCLVIVVALPPQYSGNAESVSDMVAKG